MVTYRHLLSAGSLNPSNPLRVIAHCDVDAAYAQFEASRLGVNSGKVPLAVQQWNGLIAISYAARAYGITRHETPQSALQKCPHLQLVHVATYAQGSDQAQYNPDPKPETHKVSLDPYRRESKKIIAVFKQTCPSGAVEKASIDESYFDLTIEVRKLMLERYPWLANIPTDGMGIDTPLPLPPPPIDWQGLGYQVRLEGPEAGEKGQGVSDQAWEKRQAKKAGRLGESEEARALDENEAAAAEGLEQEDLPDEPQPHRLSGAAPDEDELNTWTDVALALGAELMDRCRKEVIAQVGYTTSAGIASNKTLAKLCSSWRKPNAQTIMRPAAVANFLRGLPFQKIRFLGGKLGDAMATKWESSTVGDMWSISLSEMQAEFGDESAWVYNVLRGIDHSEVKERVATKSMLASKNVRPTIKKTADATHWLSILSNELANRLHEAREETPNLWPKTLVFRYLRAGDVPRSRQAAFPFLRDFRGGDILKVAEKLWSDSAGEALAHTAGSSRQAEIISVSLGFSQLTVGEAGQKSIEGFFGKGGSGASSTRTPSSDAAPHNTPADDGFEVVELQLQANKKRKRPANGIGAMFAKAPEKSSESPQAIEMDEDTDESAVRWRCDQCGKGFKERLDATASSSASSVASMRYIAEQRLELQKQDHTDWHFAMSLQNEADAPIPVDLSTSSETPKSTKKSNAKPKGIASFFAKK